MAEQESPRFYICRRHLVPRVEPGHCPDCELELIECRPGDPDDPCRRPRMDSKGRVLTRAPLWWLRLTLGELSDRWEEE